MSGNKEGALEVPVKTLFVMEANSRLKVAGGEEHDLPLDDATNQNLLDLLEAAAGAEHNEIVLSEVESPARFDLLMKGKGCNPHRPVAIDVIRIPLVSLLSKKAQKALDPLVKAELDFPGTAGISLDVKAMVVMAKMQPAERAALGIAPLRVVVNDCARARQLAEVFDDKRAAVAAKVAAAMQQQATASA
eukprot:CAMPEP_0198212436 /NCGR_PEP_ID=MMETSP1445-20131203/26039_1 /TAXON_ID=36898 /ORGANISM="Pyramimonas sp., Strain CCMP2087" /LENGTH=189 /DNA_ID=CAMNT_0043886873 /DNA_START=223 /DNA_END=792 /DNA_ORIENTATION=+